MSGSEIAAFREKQALEETSAHLGLHGSAVTARHDVIIARMARQGARLLELLKEGRHTDVERMMELDDWGEGEAGGMSHFD